QRPGCSATDGTPCERNTPMRAMIPRLVRRLRALARGRRRHQGNAPRRAAALGVEGLETLCLLSVAPIPSPKVRIAQALAPTTIPEPTSTLPFQAINNTARPVTVPKFDSTLGKLISVRVVASGIVRADITSENLSSNGNDITAKVTGTFSLN